MSDCGFVQIHWTCGNLDEARKISRYLVQERLVACANIIPWIESIFLWKNQIDTQQETKVIFKTRKENFEAIREVIIKNAKYEVPEIVEIAIERANQSYLDWMLESTSIKVS